jgi:hypothetical protein
MHGTGGDSLLKFMLRLEYRVRMYRFFFLPPLYIALAAFLFSLRDANMRWVALTLAVFALGTNLFPYLLDHYLAAVTSLFILVSIAGLQQLNRIRIGHQITLVLIVLCLAEFCGWYTLHLFETPEVYPILQFETWDSINHQNPQRRIEVARRLDEIAGPLQADIDGSRVVFARDLGSDQDQKLIQYYPNRRVMLLDPDVDIPQLSDYQAK